MSFTDENTLGVVVGRRGKATSSGVATTRAMRQAKAMGTMLGTGYLGVGMGVLAGLITLYGLALFAWNYEQYPDTLLVSIAWLILVSYLGMFAVTIAARGEDMPTWMFIATLITMAVVVTLDLIAIWPLHDVAQSASASACAGACLLVAVTLRSTREILISTIVYGVFFAMAIALNTPLTPATIPALVGILALAIAPALLSTAIVRQFRRLVQTELDRVLVQSTVSAPRFAVGMMASEQLARLDLAAEELLVSVSNGKVALPLSPKAASTAASLATELRLHLIEGRRETWLHHAVTESETLGKSVALTDRGSLAGLLDPQQRDGLFAAVWLLVSEKRKSPRSMEITLGPVRTDYPKLPPGRICVPIVISTIGVARNRVAPTTWDALGRVGEFAHSTESSSLRVDIQCIVENPADQ